MKKLATIGVAYNQGGGEKFVNGAKDWIFREESRSIQQLDLYGDELEAL